MPEIRAELQLVKRDRRPHVAAGWVVGSSLARRVEAVSSARPLLSRLATPVPPGGMWGWDRHSPCRICAADARSSPYVEKPEVLDNALSLMRIPPVRNASSKPI